MNSKSYSAVLALTAAALGCLNSVTLDRQIKPLTKQIKLLESTTRDVKYELKQIVGEMKLDIKELKKD